MYWFLRSFAAYLTRLSERTVDRLATALAVLAFDLLRLRRGLILKNLRLAFPDQTPAERQALGRASMKNFSLTVLELLRGFRGDVAKATSWRGIEHLQAAIDAGQGAYVLCFHLGNWEAMGSAVTRDVAPAHVLVKKVGSSSLDRFVSEVRDLNGFLTVKRKKKGDGLTAIKEILAKNEIVGFVMDQARPGEPKLPFFGHPAKTNTSLAAIWRKLPAPIVPGYIRRVGIGKHVLEFHPALQLTVTDDAAADILRHAAEFNLVVEGFIRQSPEQYFWMHNRWK